MLSGLPAPEALFAAYSAASASCSSCSTDTSWSVVAMPMDIPIETVRPPSWYGPDHGVGKPPGDAPRIRVGPEVLAHDDELVTAQARNRVLGTNCRVQPMRHLAEQLVAGRMPIVVVDRLEAVEVAEEQSDDRFVAGEPGQRVLDVVQQQPAVRKAGQRVVQRLLPEGALHLPQRGDVPVAAHDAVRPDRTCIELVRMPGGGSVDGVRRHVDLHVQGLPRGQQLPQRLEHRAGLHGIHLELPAAGERAGRRCAPPPG